MNPNIRYQQNYTGSHSYKLNPIPYTNNINNENAQKQTASNDFYRQQSKQNNVIKGGFYRKLSQQIVVNDANSDFSRRVDYSYHNNNRSIEKNSNRVYQQQQYSQESMNKNINSEQPTAISYRLQSSNISSYPIMQKQQPNNKYYTTENFYRPVGININNRQMDCRGESANDFFNEIASQVSQQPSVRIQKTLSSQQNARDLGDKLINRQQAIHYSENIENIKYNAQSFEQQQKQKLILIQQQKNNIAGTKHRQSDEECKNCEQLELKAERVIKLMRQQLEIGVKQYTDRMNKIMVQQAREITDLRKTLINNEKLILRFERERKLSNGKDASSKYSPSKSQHYSTLSNNNSYINSNNNNKSRSPSKLSLTKSNNNVSLNNNTSGNNRQKITMVSKQLSPSKTFTSYNGNRKSVENNKNTKNDIINMNAMTIMEISQKIMMLQQRLHILVKVQQQQQQQKLKMINCKIQLMQKGLLNVIAGKLSRAKNNLSQWIQHQEDKLNAKYKQIKLISNKMNTFALSHNVNTNPTLLTHSHSNLSISTSSTHHAYSSPLIMPQNHNSNTQQLLSNPHKLLMKLKKYSSQIQDLKEHLTNLQTKEFKYDNYQITILSQELEKTKSTLTFLQKAKQNIQNILRLNIINDDKKTFNNNSNGNIVQLSRHSSKRVESNRNIDVLSHSSSVKEISKIERNLSNVSNGSSSQLTVSMKMFKDNSGYGGQSQIINNSNSRNIVIKGQAQTGYTQSQSQSEYRVYRMRGKQQKQKQDMRISDKGYVSTKYNNKKYLQEEESEQEQEQQFQSVSQYSQSHHFNNQAQFEERFSHNDNYHSQQEYDNQNREQQSQSEQEDSQQSYQHEEQQDEQEQLEEQDEFFYGSHGANYQTHSVNDGLRVSASNSRMANTNNYNNHSNYDPYTNNNNSNINSQHSNHHYPSETISRFMQVIQYRQNIPLKVQIDQTGYIKSAENGMYIVDRNMDGFDLKKAQIQWLIKRGIIQIIQH